MRSPRMKRRARRILIWRVVPLAMIACVILFFAYDIAIDIIVEDEFGSLHFIVEAIMFVGVSLALIAGAKDLFRLRAPGPR